eukprot:TRINITY_DN389_c0_g1_i1.p2 TRINITY_DN389_c0_g1~~TRINITY_DN389_c0_g1_i1.p2  ORF type:complete len:124 (-),score=19.48 TRINITY_DN389_c0_g1_i1:65-436(-)
MKYMICVDGTEQGHKAFDFTTKLARPDDTFYLLSVIKGGQPKQDAERLMVSYEEACKQHGFPYEAMIVEGADPKEAICTMVDKYDIDTLVLGTRGRSGIKKVLLGSVSAYCVTRAGCDVLVAK